MKVRERERERESLGPSAAERDFFKGRLTMIYFASGFPPRARASVRLSPYVVEGSAQSDLKKRRSDSIPLMESYIENQIYSVVQGGGAVHD